MAQRKPEENATLDQVLKLVDQLTAGDQEQLCRNLNDKVRQVTISCMQYPPTDLEMAEIRTSAQAALTKAGVTVDELKAELERVKEEHFARDYPDLTNAP